MKIKITVRKKHISSGVGTCAGTNTCPIALALNEQSQYKAAVEWSRIRLTDNQGRIFKIETTEKMRNFIDAFDCGRHVRPFSFSINIPVD
jgi:hypothetical protein